MKINSLLLPNKYNKTIYGNDFKCVNLYDKNTMPLTKGLWAGSSGISTNSSGWYVIIPIIGGLSYTISKKNAGSPLAFIITTTATVPANGVASVDAAVNAGASSTQYTFSTSSSANYLFLGLAGAGSLTDEQKAQAIEELQVEVGSEKTSYTTYKNFDNTEYVLYTGNSNAEITLNDSVANYKYIEIFFGLSDTAGVASCKVYQPNGKGASLVSSSINTSNSTLYLCCSRYDISANTMTPNNYGRFVWGATNQIDTSSNRIYIYKVVGYK